VAGLNVRFNRFYEEAIMLNRMFFAIAATTAMLMVHAARADEGSATAQAEAKVPHTGEAITGEIQEMGIEPSEYWLGVMVGPPSPEAREKLNLPKDQGLLVENVEPKSPAEKAGFKPHDVLLKANDKPLADLRDLLKLMNEVKEGKLTFDVLRDGKHETVVATLAKRSSDDIAEARDWLKKLGPKMKSGQPLRFHIVGPGQIVQLGGGEPGVAATKVEVTVCTKATLADGSEIAITRHGSDPAKVVVTHDKERSEGSSSDLTKIPEKIRPEVERLLNSPLGHINFFAAPGEGGQGNMMYFGGPVPRPSEMPGMIAVGPNVEKRLGDMQKQIDELRKQVEALQGGAKPKKE
jgi:membrane-associated protease RseP (regulator of RpoE activity)